MRKRKLIDALVEAADKAEKESYCENAVAGTVIAFRLPKKEFYMSAKIISNYQEKQRVEAETPTGKVYRISYINIIWVKTGKRWPSWVHQLLKEKHDE